jgi:hypothetical protein
MHGSDWSVEVSDNHLICGVIETHLVCSTSSLVCLSLMGSRISFETIAGDLLHRVIAQIQVSLLRLEMMASWCVVLSRWIPFLRLFKLELELEEMR